LQPVIVLLYGGNELAIQGRLAELREIADGGTGMLDSNLNAIDGRDAKPADIIGPVMAVPFLSAKRMVLVEHLLERYEPRDGTRGGTRSLGPMEPLIATLEAGIPDSTLLVFLGLPISSGAKSRAVSSKNPLVARLIKVPGVSNEEMPELKGEDLLRAIRAEAASRGVRFVAGKPAARLHPGELMPEESDPAMLIANLLQSDMLSIASELDKLALYAAGDDTTVVEVNRVCAGARVSDEFKFSDAVMDGQLGNALESLARLKRDGSNLQGLLGLLQTGYRRSANIIDLLEDRATPEEIGKSMGPAGRWPNLRDKAIRRARGLGRDGLRDAYGALVHYERTFKQGEIDEEVGFEVLIARLCALAAPARAGSR
jgi:DNA polymerase III delta subunit